MESYYQTLARLIEKNGQEYNAMIVAGSLISTSSPQCRFVMEEMDGFITLDRWGEVRAIALKHGLRKYATFLHLPFWGLHPGCRHQFIPTILRESDKVGKNEVFINGKIQRI